jgi:subtilisin family serine protease
LDVPGDVSLGTNADKAHRTEITGKGIKVAMVDTGHYKHPFFTKRGYRVAPVVLGPATSNPTEDESGHGTGESANIFAVAPDVQLLPVKINFVNSKGAFDAAVALNPDIITCSWGYDRQYPTQLSAATQLLAISVSAAWASGIIVIFAAGNGQWGFPGQHPDVISAGGVFMDQNEGLQASDYASGFMSNIYPNRRVPDLSGLVGMRPKAVYIMLPVEPGDSIDSVPWNLGGRQGGTFPQGDETTATDGWGCFSGTSAAAPQLAGTAALMKQACNKLTPTQIRDIMMKTARDVTQGSCSPYTGGHAATAGPDLATGNGLVNAHKAVLTAKIRCLGVLRGHMRARAHTGGRGPITREPIRGHEPILREPIRGREPIIGEPIRGREPIIGPEPIGPTDLEEASLEGAEGAGQLSPEDIQTLEDMVIDAELDEI